MSASLKYQVSDGHSWATFLATSYDEVKAKAEKWIKDGNYDPEALPCTIQYAIISDGISTSESVYVPSTMQTITRKDPCPNCQGDMTLEEDIETGYSRGIYLCRCGNQICQEGNDWVGAPDTICDIQFCGKKIDDTSSLCEEHLQQEAEEVAN